MIILRNLHTGFEFEYEDSVGKLLLKNNPHEFELAKATKKQKEEIEKEEIPNDEAMILGLNKKKKGKK